MGRHRVEELDRPLGLHDAGMADSAARLRPKYLTPRLLVGVTHTTVNASSSSL